MPNPILLPPARRVRADHPVKRIDGSARGHLIIDDSNLPWIVKSTNSVQGVAPQLKSTFNEYLGTRLAELLGIPVAESAIVEFERDFLEWNPHLAAPEYGAFTVGFHFGCKFYDRSPTLYDVMRHDQGQIIQERCLNKEDASYLIGFDSAVSNYDRAAFLIEGHQSENTKNILFTPSDVQPDRYIFRAIDQGNCFSANWDFSNPPNPPYTVGHWPRQILGTFSLISRLGWYNEKTVQEFCGRLKSVTLANLKEIVREMPQTWLTFTNHTEIENLLLYLTQRFSDFDLVFANSLINSVELAKVYNGR